MFFLNDWLQIHSISELSLSSASNDLFVFFLSWKLYKRKINFHDKCKFLNWFFFLDMKNSVCSRKWPESKMKIHTVFYVKSIYFPKSIVLLWFRCHVSTYIRILADSLSHLLSFVFFLLSFLPFPSINHSINQSVIYIVCNFNS